MSQPGRIALFGPKGAFVCAAMGRWSGYTYPLIQSTVEVAKAVRSLLETPLGEPILDAHETPIPKDTLDALRSAAFRQPEGSPDFCDDADAYAKADKESTAWTCIQLDEDGRIRLFLGGAVLAPNLSEELSNQGYETLEEWFDESSDVHTLTNPVESALVRDVVMGEGPTGDDIAAYCEGMTIAQADALVEVLDKYGATDGGTVLIPSWPKPAEMDEPVFVTM